MRSPDHRGVPVSEPRFTIVEIDTSRELDTFETEVEAVASLAFARLAADEVELIADVSTMAAMMSR